MNKNGFTLIELLLVISIVAIVSVLSVVMYEKSNDSAKEEEKINVLLDIQRSALLYMDLNDEWLSAFREDGYNYVTVDTLQKSNYLSRDLKDPVSGDLIPSSYIVKVFKTSVDGKNYVDTCIIDNLIDDHATCISNSNGDACHCCDFEIKENSNKECSYN